MDSNLLPETSDTRAKLAGAIQQLQSQGNTADIAQLVSAYKQKYQTTPAPSLGQKIVGGVQNVFNALTNSEQGLGRDIGSALTANSQIDQSAKAAADSQTFLRTVIDQRNKASSRGQDTSHWDTILRNYQAQGFQMPDLPTTGQVLGHAAGTALDIASFGSYGNAAKGAETGTLLTRATNKASLAPSAAIATNIEGNAPTLGTRLAAIGTKTATRATIGGATGYGYDVAGNLQQGKTGTEAFKPGWGTALGVAVPTLIGGVHAGVTLTKETAPRFINSLIKPSQANFSYGKDPGRTVSELGITGNSLPDFQKNIYAAKDGIGSQIGAIYDNPANANAIIDATGEIAKIDTAINEAAKGGKSNQGIVTALQNVKDALLYEHAVNADGVIEKVGTQPRDLSALSPQEAFQLKDLIASQTKFTGNPTDDKTVNSVLKSMYGGLKDSLNNAVGANNPEIIKLNQQYADLTSAALATQHRDMIVSRSDMISLPTKIIEGGALATALINPAVAVPAILAGATAVALDKAMASTAVKTRIATWLGSQTPSALSSLFQKNPAIRTVLYRALPKFGSQLGFSQSNQQ